MSTRRTAHALIVIALSLAPITVSTSAKTPDKPADPAERFGKVFGEGAIGDLRSASRVVPMRLGPHRQGAEEAAEEVDIYPVTAKAPERDAAYAAKLAALLLDPKSYDLKSEGAYVVSPPVVLRFYAGKAVVNVFLDFDADGLSVSGEHDVGGDGFPYVNGYTLCFTPVRPALVKIVKELFPDDERIQSLGDKADRMRRGLGKEAVAAVTEPETVECLRVHSNSRDEEDRRAGEDLILSYPVKGYGPEPDPALVAELAELLLDDKTYGGGRVMCFDPGVAYRFTRGSTSVTFLICFHCENLSVAVRDAAGEEREVVNEIVFSPGYKRLMGLTKRAFPDDPQIQDLDKPKGKKQGGAKPGVKR